MKRILSGAILALLGAALVACGGAAAPQIAVPTDTPVASAPSQGDSASGQPSHITVQHVLIGFKDAVGFQGQVPPKAQGRTQDQAKTLAYDILNKAKSGSNFDDLVKQYTDDSPPGIYSMSNTGVSPAQGEYPREQMVPAFGNVGFALKVGDIGIADYDPSTSPFGYHIIRRLK